MALLAAWKWLERSEAVEASGAFEIEKSNEQWRRTLTAAQYEVLRLHQTERPGSSSLDHERRAGTYACAGCDLSLFSSRAKFDSRTGWPSFYEPLPNAVDVVDGARSRRRIAVR
jgi:peptide-methionine (R)-S-oxide reductase